MASPTVQIKRTEGFSVAPTNQTVATVLDGLDMASAVLASSSATATTATVPTTSHASSRAVSMMTYAGPCEPIVTVVSINGSVTGHSVKQPIKLK